MRKGYYYGRSGTPHTVAFKVLSCCSAVTARTTPLMIACVACCACVASETNQTTGRKGGTTVRLQPAPRGTGIDGVGRMAAAILYLAGIEDVHYHVEGPRDSKINLFEAIFDALKQQYGRVLPCDWAAPGAGPAVAATRADDEDDDAENEDEEKEETTATTRGGGEAQAKDDAHEVEGEESEGDEEEQNWVEVHYPKRRRKPKAKPPHITDAGDDVVAVAVANNKAEAQALAE